MEGVLNDTVKTSRIFFVFENKLVSLDLFLPSSIWGLILDSSQSLSSYFKEAVKPVTCDVLWCVVGHIPWKAVILVRVEGSEISSNEIPE